MQNYKRSDKHPYFIKNDCTNVYVIKADVAFKSIKIKYFCKIILKSNINGYGADTILLQCHAVTLTFKVATQILHATRRLYMVIISVK